MSLIKDTVKRLTLKYHSTCPFEISESKGIMVSFADLGKTHGFYFHDSRIKFININQNLTEEQQKIVCAHELGHAVLHKDINTPFMRANTLFSINKIEREANRFAAELLIPDQSIAETNNIYELASLHGVPVELVKLKLFCKEDLF